MVYAYHFRILHQVINLEHHPPHQRIFMSHFLLHTLFEMGKRVKSGKLDAIAHQGLIKLIISQKLQECIPLFPRGNLFILAWRYEIQVNIKALFLLLPHPSQKSALPRKHQRKKKSKEKYAEVLDKEVPDTLVRLSTPLRSKNTRITIKIPSITMDPARRANTRSQVRESKVAPTLTSKVVPISPKSQEKYKDGPRNSDILKE